MVGKVPRTMQTSLPLVSRFEESLRLYGTDLNRALIALEATRRCTDDERKNLGTLKVALPGGYL